MRRLTALVSALALAATVAACGGSDDDGNANEGGGGTFTTIIDNSIDATAPTNPFAVPTNSWNQYNAIQLGYAKNSLTDPRQFYPALAAEWEFPDDQSEVTIHLQPDAKWSDGEDVTADDVVLSYKIAFTRGAGAFILTPGAAGAVGEVEVIDDKTVKFTQDPAAPTNTFIRGIMELIVVPEHIWAETLPADFDATLEAAQGDGPDSEAAREAVGAVSEAVIAFAPEEDVSAGPFVFERATPSEVLLTKNENFFNADNVAPDNVVIKNYTGNEQVWDYLRSGEVDNAPFTAVPPDVMEQLRANGNLEIDASYSPVVAGLAFNQSHAPYNDLHVRKALAYLIDRDQVIEVATPEGGEAPATTSGIHSKAGQEWLDGGLDELEPYAHDLQKAEQELIAAGFTKPGDEWLLPSGEPWHVTMQVVTGFSDWIAAGENIVAQLEEFGVSAETVTSADFTIYQEEMAAGAYDMGFWLLGITPSPYDVYQRIYGQTNGWTVLGNSVSYSPPGENGNWMGGPQAYQVGGESVDPGELTLSLRTAAEGDIPGIIQQLATITNENLPVIQMWDYVNTQFFVTERWEGFPADDDEALRLRAGLWMQQGWIKAK